MRHPITRDFVTVYGSDNHYIVSDYEAEAFIDWLINDKKLTSFDLVEELEYQINKDDSGSHLRNVCLEALARVPVYCSQCRKITLYANGKKIYRYKTEEHRDRISSSLVGGSNVYRKTTMTYRNGWDYYCNDCLALIHKKFQEEKESESFKAAFKYIFGNNKSEEFNQLNRMPEKVGIIDIVKHLILVLGAGAFISFIIGAILSAGDQKTAIIIGSIIFIIFIIINFKELIIEIAKYKKWKQWEKRHKFK